MELTYVLLCHNTPYYDIYKHIIYFTYTGGAVILASSSNEHSEGEAMSLKQNLTGLHFFSLLYADLIPVSYFITRGFSYLQINCHVLLSKHQLLDYFILLC